MDALIKTTITKYIADMSQIPSVPTKDVGEFDVWTRIGES